MARVKGLALALILVICVSFSLLAGCKAKNNANGTPSGGGFADPAKMKENIESGLKSLVDDGTITQAQSDKIGTVLEEMTSRMGERGSGASGFSGANGSRPSGSRPGGAFSRGSGSGARAGGASGRGAWTGSRPSGASGRESGAGGMGGFSPLASLVEDKTITQDQADTVIQRIFGDSLTGGFGGQGGQGGGQGAN